MNLKKNGDIAKQSGFERAFGAWFRESSEVIHVIDLQRSNFGGYYYLNIKIYIQGVFGTKYIKDKALIKDMGDVFVRQPPIYSNFLDLDNSLSDIEREEGLKTMFAEFVVPFCQTTSTKSGIIFLYEAGKLSIPPAIKKQIGYSN